MKAPLLCAVLVAWPCGAVHAASVTVSDQNASLKVTIDEPTATLNVPNDPVQLPRSVEWTVDGRRILVYPSSPLTFVDTGEAQHERSVRAQRIPEFLGDFGFLAHGSSPYGVIDPARSPVLPCG